MKIVVIFSQLVIFVFLCFSNYTATGGIVKQSTSGLCHPPQSSWYDRTRNYIPFDTVQACLDAAGRLPKGISPSALGDTKKAAGASTGAAERYQRSAFGHGWDDANGDCRDSRAEALVADKRQPIRNEKVQLIVNQ